MYLASYVLGILLSTSHVLIYLIVTSILKSSELQPSLLEDVKHKHGDEEVPTATQNTWEGHSV